MPNTDTQSASQIAQRLFEDAELGQVAMRFVDRAGDVHPGIDDSDTICADFYNAMTAVLNPRWERRMQAVSAQEAISKVALTDLELEKLAADAAGHKVELITRNSGGSSFRITGVPLGDRVYWTPLFNDVQAHRLAVQQKVTLIHTPDGVAVMGPTPVFVPNDGDCYAAARRAIVTAVALRQASA